MTDEFANVYADTARAAAYARLEYPGTYHLAFRDLPGILHKHILGRQALDFGCGTGRSTRYLRDLGYHAVGVDIAEPMLAHARALDPQGEYRLVPADAPPLEEGAYDLVFAAFTFDNIPTADRKVGIFQALRSSLTPRGRIVMVVSDPAIYRHEWASFSTRDFPENHQARDGDVVRLVMLDVPDRRPVEDILCTPDAYRETFQKAGLIVLEAAHPVGRAEEPYAWVSETTVAPWTIYVLRPPVTR
ncbi:MAG: class I SAM-dependent methyltransferase [Gemmatimonadaceae bacterium]|nr:class I SAM-dependent methyltransferase [Gemmatimonadaceae bacterium]